jgi:hypothetical protein
VGTSSPAATTDGLQTEQPSAEPSASPSRPSPSVTATPEPSTTPLAGLSTPAPPVLIAIGEDGHDYRRSADALRPGRLRRLDHVRADPP